MCKVDLDFANIQTKEALKILFLSTFTAPGITLKGAIMYHSRWKGSHYSAGFSYGNRMYKNNVKIDLKKFTTDAKMQYSKAVFEIYREYYPEIIEEIKGFADGLRIEFEKIFCFLTAMYVFTYDTYCSMLAISNNNGIYFARNGDFLTHIKKLSDSVYYKLDKGYSFVANTTAMIQMEDGINEKGLACGLTFVYPTVRDIGFNAGFLIRYILEKCEKVEEVKSFLEKIPVGSSQNIVAVDRYGSVLSCELNSKHKDIQVCECAFKTNHFVSDILKPYKYQGDDDIFSHDRYKTMKLQNFSDYTLEDIFSLIKGEKGFMCQYDKKEYFDTIWSSVYDITNKTIYRCEGNPGRKNFVVDTRLRFGYR